MQDAQGASHALQRDWEAEAEALSQLRDTGLQPLPADLLQWRSPMLAADLLGDQPVLWSLTQEDAFADLWAEQVPVLIAEGFRVLRIDMRGHGGSSPVAGNYQMSQLYGDVVEVIDLLPPEALTECRQPFEALARAIEQGQPLLGGVGEEPAPDPEAAARELTGLYLKRLLADGDFMKKLREQKTMVQAGFMALDPQSGEIRAWVGSRDFEQDKFDHVQQARRQPGSTFKPFVYGAAFLQGAKPEDTFIDEVPSIPLPGGKVWRPTDGGTPSGEPTRERSARLKRHLPPNSARRARAALKWFQ